MKNSISTAIGDKNLSAHGEPSIIISKAIAECIIPAIGFFIKALGLSVVLHYGTVAVKTMLNNSTTPTPSRAISTD